MVVAIKSILVLNLGHDNGAAVARKVGLHPGAEPVEVSRTSIQERLVVGANDHSVYIGQPKRDSAPLVLPANIWTNPQYDLEAMCLSRLDPSFDVVVPVSAILARLGLELVPVDIRKDSIQAHGPSHRHAVIPELPWDAPWVHLPAHDDVLFSIQKKVRAAPSEIRHAWSNGNKCQHEFGEAHG